MNTGTKERPNNRRSTRIALSIPVEISSVNEEGNAHQEWTHTLVVNKHGAKIRSRIFYQPGSYLYAIVPHLQRG